VSNLNEVTDKFKVVCNKCSSENVDINISANWSFENENDLNVKVATKMILECNDCGNKTI